MSGSKFSVLHIDDDSDCESFAVVNTGNKKSGGRAGAAKKPGNANQKKQEFIVHAVERQRPKNKKNNKDKAVDPATGYVIQDKVDSKKEEVRHAVHRISESSESTSFFVDKLNGEPPQIEKSITNEFYGQKYEDVAKKLEETEQELAKSQSKVEYWKDKYRKLVELFKDAELTEKAKLVMELDRSQTTVVELTTQLALANANLEQTRSRLRLFEGKK